MKHLFILLLSICAQIGISQNNTVSSGGNATGSGGTSAFSVGQVFFKNVTGAGGASNQGVQQSFEITTSIGEEFTNIRLLIKVYPNPVTSFLNLIIEDTGKFNIQEMNYQLFDLNGKECFHSKIADHETTISMENLVSTIYFLNVLNKNKIIKSFKIIKN